MVRVRRNRETVRSGKFRMNLQLFAEGGDGAGAEGGNGSGSGDGDGNGAEGGSGGKGQSFDDFLKGEGNQAEFDRRVQKAVNTAVTRAQEKWQALTDDKLSEADKLAKMTKDEKAQYLQQKKEKELADKESELTRRELKAEAKNTLAEKKLPTSLAEILDCSSADACNKSIETVEKAFQAAVEAAVQERLKGDKPPKNASQTDEMKELENQIYAYMKG